MLPVRKAKEDEPALRPFASPEGASPPAIVPVTAAEEEWQVNRDLVRGVSTLEVIGDTGRQRFPEAALEVQTRSEERYSYRYDDFDSARVETVWTRSFHRAGWDVRTVTRTVVTADGGHFRIRAELDAYENESRVLSKSWDTRIRRDLV